jgi:hypothetical protein
MKRHSYWRSAAPAVLPGVLLILFACAMVVAPCPSAGAQDAGKAPEKSTPATPAFSEADAVRVLSDLRQGMESENPGRFLKPFDAKKMPGFAAFRDQIAEFFETYSPVRMNYHVTEVTTEGDFGAAVVQVMLDGLARQGATSNIRKTVATRVVFGWDGKTWKIVDWSPREMFR